MEIKVGIRVKVLVSPLPPRVYYSPEDPFLLSLPGSLRCVSCVFLFPLSLLLLLCVLVSSPSLRLLLRFGRDPTRPQAVTSTTPAPVSSSSSSSVPTAAVPIFFSRPGRNNLRPSRPSSERYFCNVLTDNRFSFCFTDYRKICDLRTQKNCDIRLYIHGVSFSILTLIRLRSSFLCRFLKNVDGGPAAG